MSEKHAVTQNLKLFLPEQAVMGGQVSADADFHLDIIPTNSMHMPLIRVISANETVLEFRFVTTAPYDISIIKADYNSLTTQMVSQAVAILKAHFGFSESPLMDLVGRKHEHLNLELFRPCIRVLTSDMLPTKPSTIAH